MNIPGYTHPKIGTPEVGVEVKLIIRCNTWPECQTQTATGHLEANGSWFIQGFEGACFSVLAWSNMGNPNGQSTETL